MRSFTLSVFATLAFGLFCSAAPTPAGVPPVLQARGDEVPAENSKCLDGILDGLVDAISPIADKISHLQTVEATGECLTPILVEVNELIVTAVSDVKAIPVEKALVSITEGVLLDVGMVVGCLSSVLHVVFLLIQCVLGLVAVTVKGEILPLVIDIVCSIGDLLTAVLDLVGDLLPGIIAALRLLIGDIVDCILSLGVEVVIKILCL